MGAFGPNTTGKNQTTDYNVGRGVLYVSKLNATTRKPTSWRDMGNAPAFSIRTASEKLTHQSSRSGLKLTDKEITVSQDVEISLTLDEFSADNLILFLSGETASFVNAAIAGFSEHVMVPNGELEKLRWYDIVNASGGRAYDIDAAKLTVKSNAGSPVTLVLNTDYTLNAEMGMIFILDSAAITTAIAGPFGLRAVLVADAGASPVTEIRGLTKTPEAIALKFISENASDDGKKAEIVIHQTTLSSDGDMGLISDEFGQMQFTGKAESNATASPNSPTMTIRKVTTP